MLGKSAESSVKKYSLHYQTYLVLNLATRSWILVKSWKNYIYMLIFYFFLCKNKYDILIILLYKYWDIKIRLENASPPPNLTTTSTKSQYDNRKVQLKIVVKYGLYLKNKKTQRQKGRGKQDTGT